MEKESLLSYFTKDPIWVTPFVIGSILFYINFALNNVQTQDITVNLLTVIGLFIVGCLTQGFFALNTNSLINCPKGEVKLASFSNPLKLFVVGLKFFLAAVLYGAGIGITAALIIPIGASMGMTSPVSIILMLIWIVAIVYLLWMFIYMSFAYSRYLSFRSMFNFSNFGKYKVGKYIFCGLVFILLIIVVSAIFAMVIKDKKTFIYFIDLVLAPASMWYSLILSKIQAESVQDAIAKEGSRVGGSAGTIPNINISKR